MTRWLLLLALAVFCVAPRAHAQDQATIVATCGSANYIAGGLANRTIDVNGVLCTAGGGTVTPTSVWSASDAAAGGITLTNGGLTATGTVATWNSIRSSTGRSTGLLYVEFKVTTAVSANAMMFGLANATFNPANYLGSNGYSFGVFQASTFESGFSGGTINNVPLPASGDVWGIAINFTTGSVWLAQNNVWFFGGNPATGALPFITVIVVNSGPLFASLSFDAPGTGTWTLQSTAASQTYAPPSGFTPWN